MPELMEPLVDRLPSRITAKPSVMVAPEMAAKLEIEPLVDKVADANEMMLELAVM